MRDDKERLMKMLLLDMKHWSLDALKVALNYIDGQILSFTSDDFLWWWELRKAWKEFLKRQEQKNAKQRKQTQMQ